MCADSRFVDVQCCAYGARPYPYSFGGRSKKDQSGTTPATAMTLRFERDDLLAVNQQALKPLWLAAGAGTISDDAIAVVAWVIVGLVVS